MAETISLAFTGSDTGIARLVTDLEEAGADTVVAEPEPVSDDSVGFRQYNGHIDGLEVDRAIAVAGDYLATTTGHRVLLNGIEVPPAT